MDFTIKTNSNKVVPGDTFVAIKGFTVDGHKYIDDAIKRGATKIVVSEDVFYEGVEIIKVDDTKKWLQETVVSTYKDYINNNLKIIGVTGTNGKTTTCFLTYETLKEFGEKACYIGTIGYYDNDTQYDLPNTTPTIDELYGMLVNAVNKGIKYAVMEVSSIGLVEKRVEGLEFSAAGFTNLTQDHLDYHKNFENYLNAKLLIQDQTKGKTIVNGDDSYAKSFMNKPFVSYGFNDSNNQIISYEDTREGTKIKFKHNNATYTFETGLKKKFNVYNVLMSSLLLESVGFYFDEVLYMDKYIEPPKGRCQLIPTDNGNIIIDYAHTPDAVEKIVDAFNEEKQGRVITIVGCGGDRDPLKRPIMGQIATEKSDYVIITSDNPRTEDPNKIIEDILTGVHKTNYEVITSREEAIKRGVKLMNENDTLLILGKGHEDYQIIGKTKYHFDDAEIAREALEELLYEDMDKYQTYYSQTITPTLTLRKTYKKDC